MNNKVILSFDDGPEPVSALAGILSVLKDSGVTAEFYMLGSEMERNPEAIKRVVALGHSIQNHSWSHRNLETSSEDVVYEELNKTQSIIREITGSVATKVRPPYGAGGWPKKYDPELVSVSEKLSLRIRNWDVDTEDWRFPKGLGAEKLQKIDAQLKRRKSNMNVLLHVQKETARDLRAFIEHLKRIGFEFGRPVR